MTIPIHGYGPSLRANSPLSDALLPDIGKVKEALQLNMTNCVTIWPIL